MSYIRLNQVTRVITYPMPRCNNATGMQFGDAAWHWLLDCPQGYHQVSVNEESREKLAFAGPGTIKWRYCVMPFGPVNGPSIFIRLIHDWDKEWKTLAAKRGVQICADNNSKITRRQRCCPVDRDMFQHTWPVRIYTCGVQV